MRVCSYARYEDRLGYSCQSSFESSWSWLSLESAVLDRFVRVFAQAFLASMFEVWRCIVTPMSRRRDCARRLVVRRNSIRSQQRIDLGGTHHRSVIDERLVVHLDRGDIVKVVHHDAERFLDAAGCGVAEPVDPFQPRAV